MSDKVGFIFVDVEDLCLSFLFDSYFLVPRKSNLAKWLADFVDGDRIIFFDYSPEFDFDYGQKLPFELIRQSNITDILKWNGIGKVFVSVKPDDFEGLKSWGSDNNIELLTFNDPSVNYLEDKICFDDFLSTHNFPKPQSCVYRHKSNPVSPIEFPIVIQEPDSWSGEGTFILHNENEFQNIFENGTFNKEKDYLLRRFIQGDPLGITLLVYPDAISLSSIRRQCFFESGIYCGLQWVPKSSFSNSAVNNINELFQKLGNTLLSEGLIGTFGFDFILDEHNDIYFIECNPRLTSATSQLFLFPNLISGFDLAQIIFKNIGGKNTRFKNRGFHGLPDSEFCGSLLSLDTLPGVITENTTTRPIIYNGIYRELNDNIVFVDTDVRKINEFPADKTLIFVSDVKNGEDYQKHISSIGYMASNYPLYTAKGRINDKGKSLLEYFKEQVLC